VADEDPERNSVLPLRGRVVPAAAPAASAALNRGVYRVCTGTGSHWSPSQTLRVALKARRFAPGMASDGLAHTTKAPFKQRVPGSIPGRLMRKIAHLPRARS
jgi:hypothetical protein